MNARILLLPLALAALGCQNGTKKAEASAPQPYKFPHSMHIESGVACVECHAPILKSTAVRTDRVDVALPQKNELCLGCHDPVPDYKPVMRFGPVVRFDHSAHIPRLKGQKDECQGCHVKVAEPGALEPIVPTMATCTACHNHRQDYAVGRCTPCHTDLKRYAAPLKDYSHDAAWLEKHGQWARASVNTCASCHDQTMCAVCHTATTRPMPPSIQFPEKVTSEFIHRGDWISRHAMEQAADPTSCTKCHGPGYCQSCHSFQNRVLEPGSSPLRVHPEGWHSIHGQQARQNITSCAACHNQGANSVCVTCHGSASVRVNPHPPGWKNDSGSQAQKTSNPTCRICHFQ